ncbi:MAG: hypothetical protein ACK5RC_07985 [Curvibacter sp.]|jgi:hypothetical protein|nr:hypothetical protein [Curvibacter sp.]
MRRKWLLHLAEVQALSDERSEKGARRRRFPGTGPLMWATCQTERIVLGALHKILPKPSDMVLIRRVGIDGRVSFESR